MAGNRLLVTAGDSHITEQRRIEEEICRCRTKLEEITIDLAVAIEDRAWDAAGGIALRIEKGTDYLQILEYRLEDVVGINEQFARIQVHIDRLEQQLKEQENAGINKETNPETTDDQRW